MPRKKRTTLAGTDPEYTTDFSQPLPTNKVTTPEPQDAASAPATPKPVVEKPKQPAAKKTTTKPKPTQKTTTPPKKPTPKPVAKSDPSEKREIAVAAAVKVDQDAKLRALEEKGVSPKDAITIAGRRAVERFEPKPEFIPKAEAERMPMRDGYKSTKRVSAAMLDALRDKHDPLRLSSDGAMLRGQFEPLFWTVLDEVIDELTERFS
jgi:outer membrane biosynthesis protein TonB